MNDATRGPGPRRDRSSKNENPEHPGFDPLRDDESDTTKSTPDTSAKGGVGGTGIESPGFDISGLSEDDMSDLMREALALELGEPVMRNTPVTTSTPVPSSGDLDTPANDPLDAAPEIMDPSAALLHEELYLEGTLDNPEWCQLLLDQPMLRADLCDLGQALDDADASTTTESQLRPHVKEAALLAFERAAASPSAPVPEPTAEQSPSTDITERPLPSLDARRERVLRSERRFGLGWRAAAAIVLVALGVTVVALGSILKSEVDDDPNGDAYAGISFDSMTTHNVGSMPGFETHPRWVRVGTSFVPQQDQVLVFGLGESSWLRVREGDRLAVAAKTQLDAGLLARAQKDLSDAGRALEHAGVLRLEAGEALLSTAGHRPVLLAVADDLLLVLWNGAGHVAIDPAADAVGPALALRKGARAIVYRTANGKRTARSFELAGPQRVLLGPDGPQAAGSPAASQFRDLELFGGPLTSSAATDPEIRAAASLWRRLAGDARRTDGRFRIAAGTTARLAFGPQGSLQGATALKVALRAPKGTLVRLLAAKAAEGEEKGATLGSAALDESTGRTEPGVAVLRVPLRADWFRLLHGGDLVLEIVTPESEKKAETFFEGVAFVVGARAGENQVSDGSSR